MQVQRYREFLVGSASTHLSPGSERTQRSRYGSANRLPDTDEGRLGTKGLARWRGLHAASKPPNDAFFLVSASFGRYAGIWPMPTASAPEAGFSFGDPRPPARRSASFDIAARVAFR